ncbi:MAG: efflux RND transporter periplasmic adaptor subunit [Planctomycetes bacterium]|nr:efflux RND transporter periplasmic adaptor subunit [Planctomycetota bacterium]
MALNDQTKTVDAGGGGLVRVIVVVVAAVVVALGAGFLIRRSGSGKGEEKSRATFAVRRGDLDITIHQTGDLQTKDPIKIMAEISGEATIVELAEEGSRVKEGDLLVKLDSSQLEDKLTSQEIELENSKARLIQAEEGKKIQELTNATSISNARLGLENAEKTREKYGTVALDENGFLDDEAYSSDDAPEKCEAYQQFRDAELEIMRRTTGLEKAQRDFKGMDELAAKGYVTRNDFLNAELAVEEAERGLESARLAHALLRKYTYPARMAGLDADVEKARGSLKQAELSAKAQMAQKEASIAQSRRINEKNGEHLEETKEELSKMTITAPEEGLVLYGAESNPWERDSIKVGGKVYRGRVIITLPRVSKMMAATKVLEKDVNKVKVGQKATVELAALADLEIAGEVTRVASVASTGRRWFMSSESKSFDVEVSLETTEERMRPGMSCNVRITVDALHDVLYVPVNAVFKREGRDVCYVTTGKTIQERPVKVGQDNDIYVEITQGLDEGEDVLLYSVTPAAADKTDKAEAKPPKSAKPDKSAEAEKPEEAEKAEKAEEVEGAEKAEEAGESPEAETSEKTEKAEETEAIKETEGAEEAGKIEEARKPEQSEKAEKAEAVEKGTKAEEAGKNDKDQEADGAAKKTAPGKEGTSESGSNLAKTQKDDG